MDPGKFENVTSFGKLDSKWLGGWLQHRLAWPSDVFQRAVDHDEDSLKQMLQFLLVVNPQAKLPRSCMDKAVIERLFAERLRECGERHQLIANHSEFVASDGRLKWELGLFRFKWAESGEATHVVHLPTKAEVDLSSQATLTKAFEMRAHWGDHCAMAVKGAARLMLHGLWPEGAGPNAVAQWGLKSSKVLEAASSRIASAIELQRQNSKASVIEVQFTGSRTVAKQTSAAERARVALAKRKAETDSKRRVKLSDV